MATELVALLEAAKFFPTRRVRTIRGWKTQQPHINTLRRYAAGQLKNGRRLQVQEVGGRVFTTEAWVNEFIYGNRNRTEPASDMRVDDNVILRRLKAKGLFGAKAKNEVLGVRRDRNATRAVSRMSAGCVLRSQNREGN